MYRFLLVVACLIVPCTLGAAGSGSHGGKGQRSVSASERAPVKSVLVRTDKDDPCEEEETHRKYAPGGRFYPDDEPTLRQKIERARLAWDAAQVVIKKGKANRIDRRVERRCDRGHDRADELREEANMQLEDVLERIAND